jgi:hypothetical protein
MKTTFHWHFFKSLKRISWYWDTLLSHYFKGAQWSRKIFYFKLASTPSCKSWKEIFDIISSFWHVHDMIFKLPYAWLKVVLTFFCFDLPTPHNFQERSFFSTNESSLGLIMMFFSLFCYYKKNWKLIMWGKNDFWNFQLLEVKEKSENHHICMFGFHCIIRL